MHPDSCFPTKLKALYQYIFSDSPNLNTEFVNCTQIPAISGEFAQALGLFYALFAEHHDFMKCMYDMKLPDELVIENDRMLIAVEQQGVCAYSLDTNTGTVVQSDRTGKLVKPLDLKIEDFLLYLIAIQCTQYCLCSGMVEDCRSVLKETYSDRRITGAANNGAVYLFSEGVILVVSGNDGYVSSRDDDRMAAFEENTGFDVDYF